MAVNKIHDHRENRSKQNTWDEKTAEWYTAEYGEHISNNLTIDNIDLGLEDIVLDIGCGSGKAARLAAKICTNGKVIGIDPSAAMIRISNNNPDGKLVFKKDQTVCFKINTTRNRINLNVQYLIILVLLQCIFGILALNANAPITFSLTHQLLASLLILTVLKIKHLLRFQ